MSGYEPGRLGRWSPDDAAATASGKPGNPMVPWLVVIAGILAVLAFWVIATPHEQCYIGTSHEIGGREFTLATTPIERVAGDRYRGVPAAFRDGDSIKGSAVIQCRWELGQAYRVFGG